MMKNKVIKENFNLDNFDFNAEIKNQSIKLDKAKASSHALQKANHLEDISKSFVDLDLPSGILWCKYNLGAKNPEDTGKYFQWGATTGYDEKTARAQFNWETTPGNNSQKIFDYKQFNEYKHTLVDEDNKLLQNNDAAFITYGPGCYIPTEDDFNELYHNTIIRRTIVNDVLGIKLMSKSDKSKYIFIPVTGYIQGKKIINNESNGYYWSSMIYKSNGGYAINACMHGSKINTTQIERCYGLCIRPVFKY